jgi:hypothetical protein
VTQAFRGERAAISHSLETMFLHDVQKVFGAADAKAGVWKTITHPWTLAFISAPRGWVCQNLATIARLEQASVEIFDPGSGTVSPSRSRAVNDEIEKKAGRTHLSPYNILVTIAVPNASRAWQALASTQTKVNQALLACALERCHLAQGHYPETLDALVPQYLENIPLDLINGEPLHYRRTDDGRFLLYSVGWNETDEGGKFEVGKGGWVDPVKADWVWDSPKR